VTEHDTADRATDRDPDDLAEEREALRASLRGMLERSMPQSRVREVMETDEGHDRDVWAQLATQLGLAGLGIPEAYQGLGMGPLELAVVFEELGRTLFPGPFFSTVGMAVPLLLACGDDALNKEWLPQIAAGEALATVAITEQDADWDLHPAMQAVGRDGGWRLSGSKWYVVDGLIADLVLVVAGTGEAGGVGAFAVPGTADGLTREPMVTMDQTRKMARLTFDDVAATAVTGSDEPALRRGLDLAAVALSAENVGAAQRCLELSADYARERIQFGRPIGSFQAVKHKLADMLIEVEQARSAAYFASREAAADGDDLPLAASLAKAYSSDAFFHAAADTVQVHGGIGFTWEHPAHLYLKRAKTNQLLLGSPSWHRERVADRVGI
jgi:alkylation response protein AidB-like acyl-CoA dehydrogenase